MPTELLYAIVQELSDNLDAEALTALRGTNRKFRDVVFRGWTKPMLEKRVGRRFLPEAIALHQLPPQAAEERGEAREWFVGNQFYEYLKAHAPQMKNKSRAGIGKPQVVVNDNPMSKLSVHAALALVEFHEEHIMQGAAILAENYKRNYIPLKEPGFADEVSLDDEVIKAANAMCRVEHYFWGVSMHKQK